MTISSARTREWRRLAAGAVALAVADYLLGLTPWLLLAGACAYVAWSGPEPFHGKAYEWTW